MAGLHNPASLLDYSTETLPTNTPDRFSFKDATFEEVLEDLLSRFILNLPEDELAEVERVCFQIEQAHWYYEDFIREEKPAFPSLPLKKFSEILFRSCPLLHRWSHDHESAFNDFMEYKTRVPVCGAIMLNESLTKCVLVKGWKASAGWGFPKGKVNENEDEVDCAVREVLEETGYNLGGKVDRQNRIELCVKQQPVTLFVVPGIPETFVFLTQTRKEISKIDWFSLAELPGWKRNNVSTNSHKFYLIAPVIHPLKNIVRRLRREKRAGNSRVDFLNTTLLNSDKGLSASGSEESPVSAESSAHTNCIEADVSSSQSSSIDPHTPLRRGDDGPVDFDRPSLQKDVYSVMDDVNLIGSVESPQDIRSLPSDNGNHWNRIMSLLSDSGKSSSTTDTPRAPTPAPIVSSPQRKFPDRILNGHVQDDSASVWNEDRQLLSSTNHHLPGDSIQRFKQLQLLDSILAEENAKRDEPSPGSTLTMETRLPLGYNSPIGHDRPTSVNRNLVKMPCNWFAQSPRLAAPGAVSPTASIGMGNYQNAYSPPGLASARHTIYRGDAGLARSSTASCTPIVNAANRNQMLAILRDGPGLKAEAGVIKGNHAALLSILNNGVRR